MFVSLQSKEDGQVDKGDGENDQEQCYKTVFSFVVNDSAAK